MPPAQVQELVAEVKAWYETHDMLQRDLAEKLGVSPTGLSQIFSGANRPSASTALAMIRFLEEQKNMKTTTFIDPRATPRQAANNPGPKTLTEARDRIADLEAQLRGSAKPAAAPASPKAKAQPARDPGADPIYPPITTPGADRPNKTEMQSGPAAPSITLSADLDSPVKIQKVLDQMNLDDLRLALNGTKDKLQSALLYREISKAPRTSESIAF
jgi:DNA-binding XRE family transcriptional regulator